MDAKASVALGGKDFVATLNKPWRQSLRGRIGKALGTPWEALGTRSSFVVRRRSFVARLSPFVVRRWSLVGGHLGNSSFRKKDLRMLWQVLATP